MTERKTVWSTIKEIRDLGDGMVEYLEEFDPKHPMCPLVKVKIENGVISYYAERKRTNKYLFELIYGSVLEALE